MRQEAITSINGARQAGKQDSLQSLQHVLKGVYSELSEGMADENLICG
jgi:hypothetical protein